MLSGKDIYTIIAAIMPLYVAMIIGYASVRFWNIFDPQQCAGINRYVASYAVPILSFDVIASCNFYDMNYRFIGGDTLQKVVILAALLLWIIFSRKSSLEWVISFFSLSTLPNTLIIGIPLLQAMYGEYTRDLMVQIVVLQGLIWYTLLLILFEYRGAMILINENFPDCSWAITSIRVDPDVVSLNGCETLETEAEIDDNGRVHVVVRRSSVSSMESPLRPSLDRLSSITTTPRASNLSGVEIYSLQSWSRNSSLNNPDGHYGSQKHGISGSSGDASDWIVNIETAHFGKRSYRGRNRGSELINSFLFPSYQPSHRTSPSEMPMMFRDSYSSAGPDKGLHMFAWGSRADKSRHASSRITHCPSDLGEFFQNLNIPFTNHTSQITWHPKYGRGRLNEHAENASKMSDEERNAENASKMSDEERNAENASKMSDEERNAVNAELGRPPLTVMTRLVLLMVWRKLIVNPNIYSSVIGLAWSLLSFKLHIQFPLIVSGSIKILSDTGLGMAMFSIGLFMGSQPTLIPCGYWLAALSMVLKFIVGPLVAAATSAALGLRGELLCVSIVQAALPEAVVPFVFANQYKVHADIMSVSLVFGILLSLPVGLVYYAVLEAI
ncbi:hypothetical protein ACJRO7_030661 [Eucalyptus globulus]|uniref:Auxin efflux carrier component n=1 Tax=Eucalyptus globulus TaxID=34317 RepID=A0ABD3JJN4_EUCGL